MNTDVVIARDMELGKGYAVFAEAAVAKEVHNSASLEGSACGASPLWEFLSFLKRKAIFSS